MAMKTDIHLRYRPADFGDVVGHKDHIRSLEDALVNDSTHAFVFTGPSGTGKTTLARIIAKHVDCDPRNLIEIDAATNTGIDAMRDLTSKLIYSGFGKSPAKVVVVDEAHALSNSAWQSLLKNVEEPPPHVYWVFCTTDGNKIPKTIKTRCHVYDLKPIETNILYDDLLLEVRDKEGMECPDEVVYVAAQAAKGSPRQALTNLSQVATCASRKEALAVLSEPDEEGEAIELIRAITQRKPWGTVSKMLKGLEGTNPESLRIQTMSYFMKMLLGTSDESKAEAIYRASLPFLEPYPQNATFGIYVASVADSLFS